MKNIEVLKTGIIAVSRDCFPIELSRKRRKNVVSACLKKNIQVSELETIIENEKDVLNALNEIDAKKINALVIFLGNFGPEGPLTILAQKFNGPVMLVAAAEETKEDLIHGRGDAFCGMLNASYNVGLRNLKPYIPDYPVGDADEVADMIAEYLPVARTLISIKKLKIFSFGPRPQDFLACNAPIKPLYDLGVEIMENSELDLYELYKSNEDHKDIPDVVEDMKKELGKGNAYPDLLQKLARYEITLKEFMENNLGASTYGAFANKCWPAFEHAFGFVPCYVNARFAERGIPIACETDIYGALSEYIITAATDMPATILDINNTVPKDMYSEAGTKVKDYRHRDMFMGFHCGNTCSSCLTDCSMKYQLIMHSLMEPGKEPDITRGTLEGTIRPGDITLFRLQSTADTKLKVYMAEGEVLNINPRSFGSIAVFAVKEMDRFYRHVLINKGFPHHSGIAFKHVGKSLHTITKLLGVEDVDFNRPSNVLYPGEYVNFG